MADSTDRRARIHGMTRRFSRLSRSLLVAVAALTVGGIGGAGAAGPPGGLDVTVSNAPLETTVVNTPLAVTVPGAREIRAVSLSTAATCVTQTFCSIDIEDSGTPYTVPDGMILLIHFVSAKVDSNYEQLRTELRIGGRSFELGLAERQEFEPGNTGPFDFRYFLWRDLSRGIVAPAGSTVSVRFSAKALGARNWDDPVASISGQLLDAAP